MKAHVINPQENSKEWWNAKADELANSALRRQIAEERDNLFEENSLSRRSSYNSSNNGDNDEFEQRFQNFLGNTD